MNENDQLSVIEYTARLAALVAPNALAMSGKTVQFIGDGPFGVGDLEVLLPSDAEVVTDEAVDEDEISAAVDARLHDVRHFHISNLLRNGVAINAVQVRAGHSSPMVTLSVYGHVIPGEDELAATVFAQVMAGSEKS